MRQWPAVPPKMSTQYMQSPRAHEMLTVGGKSTPTVIRQLYIYNLTIWLCLVINKSDKQSPQDAFTRVTWPIHASFTK
jgi:hypothetical protein